MNPLVITAAFAATGTFLYLGGFPSHVPVPDRPDFDRGALEVRTLREPMGADPKILVAGLEKRCMSCHALWESKPEQPSVLVQHTDTWLDHGTNDNCLNCHDREQRDRLALRNGKTTSFDDPVTLCAQCHGTTWRDWQEGSHGRTNGYWDRASGEQVHQVCTACHDPHHPAFPRLEPLPGPQTLRMRAGEDPDHLHAPAPWVEGPLGRFREALEAQRAADLAAARAERERAAAELEAAYEALGIDPEDRK